MEEDGEDDPIAALKSGESAPISQDAGATILARQEPVLKLVGQFHDLFWELPNLSTRDVDSRLQGMYDNLMNVAAGAGISRISIPPLRECCGKKRAWKDEPRKPFGLGDLVRWFTKLLGIKPCEGCERRRKFLNRIRLWK